MRADVISAQTAMHRSHLERTIGRMQAAIDSARFELSCSGLQISERELLARNICQVEAELTRLTRELHRYADQPVTPRDAPAQPQACAGQRRSDISAF